MKAATAIMLTLVMSSSAVADCWRLSLQGTPGFTNVRERPGMKYRVLDRLESNSGDLLWCGKVSLNGETQWFHVGYKAYGDKAWRYGWTSANVVDIVEKQRTLGPACPSLEFFAGGGNYEQRSVESDERPKPKSPVILIGEDPSYVDHGDPDRDSDRRNVLCSTTKGICVVSDSAPIAPRQACHCGAAAGLTW